MKTKIYFIALSIGIFIVSSCQGQGQKLTIMDVSKDTTIIVNYDGFSLDPILQIDVTGEIDGEAKIELNQAIVDENKSTASWTQGYYVKKRLPNFYIKADLGNKQLIRYKNLSAKKGKLMLTINVGGSSKKIDTKADYVNYK